jgi:hypothetical protein
MTSYIIYADLIIFLACVPSRNPFLNFRVMCFITRIRPVPSVRRPLALAPQLYCLIFGDGYPHDAQVDF